MYILLKLLPRCYILKLVLLSKMNNDADKDDNNNDNNNNNYHTNSNDMSCLRLYDACAPW